MLEALQGGADHLLLAGGEGVLYRDDQLGDDGEDFGGAVLEHVVHPLPGEELVGVLCLAESLEEEGEVVVVVQLLDLHLPRDLVPLRVVLERDWEVPPVVELLESGLLGVPLREGAGRRGRDHLDVLDGGLDGEALGFQVLLPALGLFVLHPGPLAGGLERERFGEQS